MDFETVLKDGLEALTHGSTRLLGTLWGTLRRPGEMITEYLDGQRKTYQSPLTYFACGYIVFYGFVHYMAEPNAWDAGTIGHMQKPHIFVSMLGMALIAYVCATRSRLTLFETIASFAFMYGTISFLAVGIIIAGVPFESAIARIPVSMRFLISDLPLIAALMYMGYGLGQRLNVALPRVALATVTGIAYYIFVREVLGFK